MIEALEFYWPAVIVAILFALTLSYTGVHLVARKQALILIPQAQVTVISILVGILFFHEEENLVVMVFSFLMTFVSGIVLYRFSQSLKGFRAEWMLGLFFVLMAIGHSLTRFFPILESHFHQSFQGDIVTASNKSLLMASIIISFTILVLVKRFNKERFLSFELAIGKNQKQLIFNLIVSLILTIGVYLLGSAFSVSFLILPSLLIARFSKSYLNHITMVLMVSFLSSLSGFLLSLEFSFLATTPTMVLMLIVICVFIGAFFTKYFAHSNMQDG